MIRPFLFITLRSFKNRILSRLRRLREPRYVIGFVAGLFYLWYMVFRRVFVARNFSFGMPASQFALEIGAMFVLTAAIVVWAFPDSGGGLTFSEAEIQFLFSAPLSRRQLLLYKIFREQPQILISTVMMTIFGLRHSRFIGLWIAFITMSIYFTMVSLARARLKLAGIGFIPRLAAVAVILAGLVGLVATELKGVDFTKLRPDFASEERFLRSTLHGPLLRAILFVPRIFAGAAMPTSTAQLLVSCALLVVIAFVFIEIAARLNVAFEEASVRVSQKRAARGSRRRTGRAGTQVLLPKMPPPFRLPARARPEIALLWKNLIASLRVSVAWIAFLGVILSAIVLKMILVHQTEATAGSAFMLLVICALFPYIGSSIFNHDLRMDLARIELLKSYPISGERLVAAEIAAPLLIISILEILLLVTATVLLQFVPDLGRAAFFATPQFVVVALLFAIPICAMQLLLRNAAVILFPGWALRSPEEARGFAVTGQRIVMLAAMTLTIAISLLPAAVVFAPAFYVSRRFFGDNSLVLAVATMPSVAVVVAEVWFLIRFLGGQFESIDVTNEMGSAVV